MKTPLLLLTSLSLLIHTLHAQTATQVWAVRYNGPANNIDYASAIAVDASGNVVVTGESHNGSNFDFYTAKYAAANGTLLWEKRYNGTGNSDDLALAVAIDASDNMIVTGQSTGSGTNLDCYTAKYAAANGALLWEKRYNGTGNSEDSTRSIAIDAAGNVLVTGYSYGLPTSAAEDYYTAKYDGADGHLLWEKRYNNSTNGQDRANTVALDSSGNVIVSGQSRDGSNNLGYYTAKYAAANGALLWEKRYSGPSLGNDFGRGLAVDFSGNVAVTGYSSNASGNDDYYTAKYASANGALIWERRYDGPSSGNDSGWGVASDAIGNVIVTGYSSGSSNDFYTAKYAVADGAVIWEKRYDGPASGDDRSWNVALDAAGNVVVGGQSSGSGSGNDFYIAKYAAADGALLWEARYNGPANGEDVMNIFFPFAGKLALTADGGAVITGQSIGIGTNHDYATVKYAPPVGDTDRDGLQDWWEQMWWGATAGHAALDDFDHDGIPELLEEAFGLNPNQPNTLPPAVNEGGYLTITITKHPGVTYEVQTAATPDAPAFSPTTTTVQVNDATTLKVRDNFLITAASARYLRVKVTAAP